MCAEFLTAGISLIKNCLGRGTEKFLSLALALVIVSCVSAADKTVNSINHQDVECSGLIAFNYLQIS